jgi:hypothetical protein
MAQVLMGTGPYNFPASNTFAAQAHISEKLNSNGGSASGMDALNEYLSSSTTVGNINNVTVGDNSKAVVNGTQTSTGNQDSTATISSSTKTVNTPPPSP